ncbi:MAG TPA: UDP-N-acetylmuramate--L-alanine ligase [Nitrospinota bacterium]|nr:UDP-N-acetylmuramate--L-alanine ligase [Nitrospinota bacterium]
MFRKTQHIHFVGIGGAGMSGIAELLINFGYNVSGSDVAVSEATERLSRLGAKISIGHDAKNLNDAEVLVISSAIDQNNVEVIKARSEKIPVIPRAEMLAELMRLKYGIAIGGTHGKTTTTSMVSAVLAGGNLDPTSVIGGKLKSMDTGAKLGKGDFLVAEADESDGSFLRLSPTIAVVTSLDNDHLEFYKNIDETKSAFLQFINHIPFYGVSIICLDDENIQALIPEIEKRFITYGLKGQADYTAKNIQMSEEITSYFVDYHGKNLGKINIKMPGIHNVLNSLAAVAVGLELDIPFESIVQSQGEFSGIERRFQIKNTKKDVLVVDDYGHHPTEIKTTLKTLREIYKEKRIIVVFQPHRYSRTQLLLNDFFTSFYDANLLIIAPIYPAGEKPIEGIGSSLILEGVKDHGQKNVLLLKDKHEIVDYLLHNTKANDVVLTLGAGDIWKVGNEFIDKL